MFPKSEKPNRTFIYPMPQRKSYDPRINQELVRRLFEQSPIATAGAVSAAVIMGIMLLDIYSFRRVSIWVAAAVAVTIFRHVMAIRFRKTDVTPHTVDRWKWYFIIILLISGITWGASGIFLFPREAITHQVILFIVLIAMVAGAVGTFSAIFPAFLVFSIPALLPVTINVLTIGDPIHYALGALSTLYLIFMTLIAFSLNRQTGTVLALKFENVDLIKYLESAKSRTEIINRNLKIEIAEREKAEQALQNHRKNLQALVKERTAQLQRTNLELRREIEERSRTESALKASEEKYRLLVENANDAICILQEGRILFHNKRTKTMLGYPEPVLGEKNYFELIHPGDMNRAKRLYLQRKNGHTPPQEYSLRLVHCDGSIIWVQVNVTAMQWGDRPATQCIIRDITKQKHLENQLLQSQKMAAIGKLAGGIAHDINNILGGIQGNISLLRIHTEENDANIQKIKDMESYIRSGSGLTRQLLGFSQPGQPEIRPAMIDHLLDRTVKLFCRTRQEIEVHTTYKGNGKTVDLDSGQMEQVFLNLLVNAWHAMPDGGSLYIQTEKINMDEIEADAFQLVPGGYVRIAVTDTGAGIDEETLPRIFEPFFTTKPKEIGTGLGLSTAYTIIRNHHGHITVYSRPGSGTTFHIYLPVSETAIADPITPDESQVVEGNETLLLVDDAPDILKIGAEMLCALGYRVIPADNGEQAVALYQTRRTEIAMIILDMIMPGMDGETVFDALRATDPGVRVLLSSGYSRSGQADRIMKKGCNGFIQKPFNLMTLSRTIRDILD